MPGARVEPDVSSMLKAYFTAKAYEWVRENIRLADRTDEHVDSLARLLKNVYMDGKVEEKVNSAEASKEEKRLKQIHDAASHRDGCYSDDCLGQCRVR